MKPCRTQVRNVPWSRWGNMLLAGLLPTVLVGCGTIPGTDAKSIEFTGNMLIAVSEGQARQIESTPPSRGSEWRFSRVKSISSPDRSADAPNRAWIVATPARGAQESVPGGNPWDLSHRSLDDSRAPGPYRTLLDGLSRAAGGRVVPASVEPEVYYLDTRRPASMDRAEQSQTYTSRTRGRDLTLCDTPPPHWPRGKGFAWHLGDSYTQLRSARQFVQQHQAVANPAERVKIALIDTGYNEQHVTNPEGLDKEASRDFTKDPGNPAVGAADPFNKGIGKTPGHGCGVLSILAGNQVQVSEEGFQDYVGGDPLAQIVFLRISDSVVHLSPVTMALAIKYATSIGCDVVSVSHGGLPSGMLADAVNEAYENGTAIFAASGDFIKVPFFNATTPQQTVYPAAFNRVVSVCGVTADNLTYSRAPSVFTLLTFSRLWDWMLRGSYGPPSAMREAIAAYAPNIPWARYAPDLPANLMDLDGRGTSAATPQASAAAALWLQVHRDDPGLAGKWRSWEKVEAVYWALFDSAQKNTPEGANTFTYFGNGILKARDALDLRAPNNPTKRPAATVGFGWLRIIGGMLPAFRANPGEDAEALGHLRNEMLRTELAQLVHGSRALQELAVTLGIDERQKDTPPEALKAFFQAARKEKRCSRYLRDTLARAERAL